jgi:nucleoside-diphosphate-sugar epimerase
VRILVAGAGYVGEQVMRVLVEAGHDVLALRRTPRSEADARVRWLACDLGDERAVRALPLAGVDALAYLVAADARDDAAYRRAYVDGLAHLLARLRAESSLTRVLFVSSTSVYAQDDGSAVDESSATEPREFSGRRVLEGEAVACGAGGTAIALRLGGIYGPGRTALLERVRRGDARLPRAPHFTNRIHRDDAARACAHLLELAAPASRYVGVDHEPADQAEVLRWLAARTGAPAPRGDYDASAAPSGKRCNSALLRASGFRFAFPSYREGYAALASEARSEAKSSEPSGGRTVASRCGGSSV